MNIWTLYITGRDEPLFVGNYTSLEAVEAAKVRCVDRGLADSVDSFRVDEEYHRTGGPYSKGEIPFAERNYGKYGE